MTPEIARAAIEFLSRTQLTGQEVPAFNAVFSALTEQASDTDRSAPPKDDEVLKGGDGVSNFDNLEVL